MNELYKFLAVAVALTLIMIPVFLHLATQRWIRDWRENCQNKTTIMFYDEGRALVLRCPDWARDF